MKYLARAKVNVDAADLLHPSADKFICVTRLGSPGGGEIAKQVYQFEKRLFGFASMPLRAKTFPTEAQDESRRWLAELEMHAVLDFVPAANALALPIGCSRGHVDRLRSEGNVFIGSKYHYCQLLRP